MNDVKNSLTKQRLFTYIALSSGLILLFIFLRDSEWRGTSTMHTGMGVIATLLAASVGYFSISKYKGSKNSQFLIIGAAFLGTALLDGYNAIVSSALFQDMSPSNHSSLSSWSWIPSRLFLSMMLMLSYVQYQREKRLKNAANISEKVIYTFIGLISIFCMLFFIFVPLPQVHYPGSVFHRPAELVPALFFLVALIGYWKQGNWRTSTFEHWLILSLILNIFSQSVFMSLSSSVFDFEFNAAHLLKNASYISVICGLVLTQDSELSCPLTPYKASSKLTHFGKQVILLISIMMIATISTTSFVLYDNKITALKEQEKLILNTDQNLLKTNLSQSIDSLKEDTLLLSKVPPITGIMRAKKNKGLDEKGKSSMQDWVDRLNTIYSNFLLTHPEYLTVRYIGIGDNGKELVRVKRVNGEVKIFSGIGLQEKDHRYYFKEITEMKEGAFYLSDITLNKENGRIEDGKIPVIRAAKPIFDANGKMFGFVILNKNMSPTFDKMLEIVTSDFDTYMTNSEGHYIIHPDKEKSFNFEFGDTEKITDLYPGLKASFDKGGNDHFEEMNNNGKNYFVSSSTHTFDYGGRSRFFNTVILSDHERFSIYSDNVLRKTLITGLILLGMSITFAWFISYTLTNPLRNITNAMEKYASDRILIEMPEDAKGEIGELARSFKFVIGEIEKQSAMMVEAHHNLEEQQMFAEKARFEAEEANKSKSEFLANMSHEIRTPLNAIIGYSELMVDDELTVEQKNMMKTVMQSSNTLLELINDILDFSKIEAGEMTLEKVEFDIKDLAFQVSEQSRGKVKAKDLQLHIISDPLEHKVIGDPTRLKQVLINLVGNAVKFTHSGEIKTVIRVQGESATEVELELEVADTGIGIAKDQLENIFQAFKQADGSTTRNYGGTGLGLNISRKLVELMGGTIEVKSTPGKGTSFYFSLIFPKGSTLEKPESVHKKDLKLLLIDKCETSRKIIKQYSQLAGISFYHEESIDKALEFMEKNRDTNLILTDLGVDKSREFKEGLMNVLQSERTPFLIALGTDISPAKLQAVKELQYNTYLYKPLRYNGFCDRINKLYETADKKSDTDSGNESECLHANILLVEDNKINQRLAMKVLNKMGHTVTLAENGKEAVEVTQSNSFDLIFMDIQMPVMDGLEATKELRSLGCKLPVIALTANAFESDKEACIEAGMDDFASKPLEREVIKGLIIKYSGSLHEEDKDSA